MKNHIKSYVTIFIIVSMIAFPGCSDSSINKENNQAEIEAPVEEVDAVTATNTEVEELVEEVVYTYDAIETPVLNTETFNGFIDDNAIVVTINTHANNEVSGSYFYKKYNKKILLIGTKKMDEFSGEAFYDLVEWADAANATATWYFNVVEGSHLSGEWMNLKTTIILPLELLGTDSQEYLAPMSAVLFKSKAEADNFFSTHHYVKNANIGKHSILCDEEGNGALLPKGITVYSAESIDGFKPKLTPVGTIVHYDRFAFDTTDATYRMDDIMSTVHMTPAENYEGLRLAGPFRTESGELYMSNTKEFNIALKLQDLVDLGYHLEGDGFYLMNTMKVGLDINHSFWEEFPLRVYENPGKSDSIVAKLTIDDKKYFIIEDVQFFDFHYWLKVNIMSEGANGNYHDKNQGKLEHKGWIRLYDQISDFHTEELTLTYYGNGC